LFLCLLSLLIRSSPTAVAVCPRAFDKPSPATRQIRHDCVPNKWLNGLHLEANDRGVERAAEEAEVAV
jgi:hypothetical protein